MKRDGDASDARPKPKYEAPVVVPLGELALGHGKTCNNGNGARQQCHNGASPGKTCTPGTSF
jgi:hypothetical protein